MRRDSNLLPPRQESYGQQTHRPLNGLLFILPLLVFFQVGAMYYQTGLLAPYHLGRLLEFFGATAPYLPPVVVLTVLIAQHIMRKDRLRTHWLVLVGMLGESMLWMLPLIWMSYFSNQFFTGAAGDFSLAIGLQRLLIAVGAGIYEEFIFRLMLISLGLFLLSEVLGLRKDVIAILLLVVTAVLFSLYHMMEMIGSAGFPWNRFVFLTIAGVYLGSVYLLRGFGIAVGAHILFDVYAFAVSTN
jgi:hypothetical protein